MFGINIIKMKRSKLILFKHNSHTIFSAHESIYGKLYVCPKCDKTSKVNGESADITVRFRSVLHNRFEPNKQAKTDDNKKETVNIGLLFVTKTYPSYKTAGAVLK